ncbi:MAG: cytochrome c biogenesis protein CcsA [Endozoicomonadaceae bacterium]|nr:cytochrome c biogenesis protein CcsA [Endozoicomonadaceae bacterium]MCY4329386.1 cytochrome c biogenesis protein CcsA [Endozoicomonadaceae bacterium]
MQIANIYLSLVSLCAASFYILGVILQWLRITGKVISKKIVLGLITLGAILQAFSLIYYIISPNGIMLNFFTTGSLCGFVIVIIVLLSSITKPLENIFAILLPFVVLSIGLTWAVRGPQDLITHLNHGIIFHIIISVLAYSTLSIATLQACLLGFQEYTLKHHKPSRILKIFPPVETMERLLFEFIFAGMILLTLSLLSGFVYFKDLIIHHISHASVLALISWFIFGVLLLGRYRWGWRGKTAIQWTLIGFIMLMLAYFGSKLIMDMVFLQA